MRGFVSAIAIVWGGVSTAFAGASLTVRDLVEIVDLSGVAISPDGRAVAYRQSHPSITSNSYDLAWYVVAMDGKGLARRIGGGGEPLWNSSGSMRDEMPQWSPDSHWLYFRALIDGQVQVWRAARDGSRCEQVTSDAADIRTFTLKDQGYLSYTVGATREDIIRAEEREYAEGILIDHTIDVGDGLFRSMPINGRLATQRIVGPWFDRGGLLDNAEQHGRQMDLRTLEVTTVDVKSVVSAIDGSARSPVTGRLVFTQGPEGEKTLWAGDPQHTAASIECQAEECRKRDISHFAWRPRREQVVFTTLDSRRAQAMFVWDVNRNRITRIASSPGLLSGDRSPRSGCALSERYVVCIASQAGVPPHLQRIELDSGAHQELAEPNGALVAVEVETLEWTDAAGRPFTGQFFLPPAGAPRPAPLFINYYVCDGYLRGGMGDEWPLAPLAAAGIAALCINKAPINQDAQVRYEVGLSAVRSAVELLSRRGVIDPVRVGMGGLSFGSEVAMWAAQRSDLLRAVSISSVQISPAYYWFNGVHGRENHDILEQNWGLRAPEETPERWRLLSSAMNAENIDAAVLMQLPEIEYRQNVELYVRLSRSGTPAEMYVFPHEFHIKTQPRHRVAVYERNLDWFRFWLQGYEDAEPQKAAQYRRWRAFSGADECASGCGISLKRTNTENP